MVDDGPLLSTPHQIRAAATEPASPSPTGPPNRLRLQAGTATGRLAAAQPPERANGDATRPPADNPRTNRPVRASTARPNGHGEAGPTQMGATLRQLRENVAVTRVEAATVLGCTSSKISDLELGRSKPNRADLEKLLGLYRVSAEEAATLLAKCSKMAPRKPRGTYSQAGLTGNQQHVMKLEEQADAASYYSADVVPAPLRTVAYSGALLTEVVPDSLRRQRAIMLHAGRRDNLGTSICPRLRYRCFLGEAVLRSQIGDLSVMLEQFRHLHDLATTLPQLELRLVPFGSEAPAFLGLSITIYSFRPPTPAWVVTDGIGDVFARRSIDLLRSTVRGFQHLDKKALSRNDSTDRLRHEIESLSATKRRRFP